MYASSGVGGQINDGSDNDRGGETVEAATAVEPTSAVMVVALSVGAAMAPVVQPTADADDEYAEG